jgi:hypothetical protein
MQYWFLGLSFMIGCALLCGPKFIELGMTQGAEEKGIHSYHEQNGKSGSDSSRASAL